MSENRTKSDGETWAWGGLRDDEHPANSPSKPLLPVFMYGDGKPAKVKP